METSFAIRINPCINSRFFSVLPKLYDIAVEPKAELTYLVTNGPEIQASDSFQRIISITIKNSGKRYLTKISADLIINNGVIQAYKLYDLKGLEPKVSSASDILKIELQKMHPNEQFVISALLSSNKNNINPDFTLRSDEILGTINKNPDSKKDNSISGGILTGAAVFIMAIIFMGRISKSGYTYKQDFLFYIVARLRLTEISKRLELDDSSFTYLRMADILLIYGLSCEDRTKFIIALKALLFIKDMASVSREIVISNIKTLEGDKYNQDEINNLLSKSVATGKIIDFRKLVDEIVEKENSQSNC